MEPVRLDPAAPFASLLAWLAALSRALGIELPLRAADIPLSRIDAAVVRAEIAAWSRRLGAVVRAQALRLALSLLHLPRPAVAGAPVRALTQPAAPTERAIAIGSPVRTQRPRRSTAARSTRTVRRDPAELLDAMQRTALKARVRAVVLALHDPSAAIRRLARRLASRLARRLARAKQAEAARRGRRRFPHPPRVLGALRQRATSPEPRPPDRSA